MKPVAEAPVVVFEPDKQIWAAFKEGP